MGVTELVAPASRVASRCRLALGLLCVLTAFTSGAAPAALGRPARTAAGAVPASEYALRHSCSAPVRGARCLATRVVAVSSGARARRPSSGIGSAVGAGDAETRAECESTHKHPLQEGCDGLTPQDLWSAYGLTTTTAPSAQTVAIVDAFDDPTVEKDLQKYSKAFELLPCTPRKPCLTKVNQNGEAAPLPPANPGWAEEISIDVEATHAICQNCHILLVEAKSEEAADLEAAEETAAAAKPDEISNSWVEPEPATESPAFDHPGIVITAGSGDEGYLNWVPGSPEGGEIAYPASSPQVVSVGGTRLEDVGGTWTSTVWNGDGIGREKGASGGGCSEHYEAPYWQLELPHWPAVGCSRKRAVADISAVADPYTGIAVYDTTPNEQGQTGWERLGGTSVASPLIAAMFALAGGSHGVESPARTLYENEALTHGALTDVVSGSNGFCRPPPTAEGLTRCSLAELAKSCAGQAICLAGPGYDGPSGLGTPDGIGAFEATGAAAKKPQQVKFISQAPSGARFDGPDYAVAAKSSSGLQVSVVSLTPSVCGLDGSDVGFSGAGTCTIEALQAGDDEYRRRPGCNSPSAWNVHPSGSRSRRPHRPSTDRRRRALHRLRDSLLGPGGSAVIRHRIGVHGRGATVSFTAAGTCTIDASQDGNADWEPATDAQQSMAVGAEPAPPVLQPVMPGPTGGALSFSSTGPSPTPDSGFTIAASPETTGPARS